jgi:hypothetical protein
LSPIKAAAAAAFIFVPVYIVARKRYKKCDLHHTFAVFLQKNASGARETFYRAKLAPADV